MTDAPERYGRVKLATISAAINDLRQQIRSEGSPAIQDKWDRLECWIDTIPAYAREAHD